MELPGLPPGGAEPDVVIRLGPVSRTRRKATIDEEIAFHAQGGAFHIKQGREIVMDPLPGADAGLLRVLLVGRMMAFLLRQRGWLSLHASGVRIGGQTILFLGASGSGKSTTAAAFHSQGHQVATDDVGAVRVTTGGQCLIRPAGPRIRLLDDSRVVLSEAEPEGVIEWDKYVFDLTRGEHPEQNRVQRIYVLEYGGEIASERIPPLSAVAVLSAHSFVRHQRMNEGALAAHLSRCSLTAGAVPLYRLFRPRSLSALPDLVRWVEIDLSGQGD
jgi:hypothetical protein